MRPLTAGDQASQTVARVAEQIVENDQRRQLTDAQRARGIQQLIDAGLSVAKVAKVVRRQGRREGRAHRRAINDRHGRVGQRSAQSGGSGGDHRV